MHAEHQDATLPTLVCVNNFALLNVIEGKQRQHFDKCPQSCSAAFGVAEHYASLLQFVINKLFSFCPM